MSPSARRLAAGVATGRFDWQTARQPGETRLTPVVFASTSDQKRAIDVRQDVEARELRLPSVAAERVQAIEQQAYADGYARGQEAAAVELERRLEGLLQRLGATIEELGALGPRIMRRADRELIHLAVAMAERIVRREVRNDPELLLVMARAAIERLGERTTAVVHLHPTDYDAIARGGDGRMGTMDVVADPEIERGGCLVRSTLGAVDAGIDAQIRELLRAVLAEDGSEEAADGPIAGH